jgi:hypothetical protein
MKTVPAGSLLTVVLYKIFCALDASVTAHLFGSTSVEMIFSISVFSGVTVPSVFTPSEGIPIFFIWIIVIPVGHGRAP